jgi:hypothetical protein
MHILKTQRRPNLEYLAASGQSEFNKPHSRCRVRRVLTNTIATCGATRSGCSGGEFVDQIVACIITVLVAIGNERLRFAIRIAT